MVAGQVENLFSSVRNSTGVTKNDISSPVPNLLLISITGLDT